MFTSTSVSACLVGGSKQMKPRDKDPEVTEDVDNRKALPFPPILPGSRPYGSVKAIKMVALSTVTGGKLGKKSL